jgi:hypothetical protein
MRVTGPVEGGRRGWPFTAAVFDVAEYGYVEEEFFIDGEATAFELVPGTARGEDGHWQARPRDAARFRTRFLVVRPADARDCAVGTRSVTARCHIRACPKARCERRSLPLASIVEAPARAGATVP